MLHSRFANSERLFYIILFGYGSEVCAEGLTLLWFDFSPGWKFLVNQFFTSTLIYLSSFYIIDLSLQYVRRKSLYVGALGLLLVFIYGYIFSWYMRLSTGRFIHLTDLQLFLNNHSAGLWGTLSFEERSRLIIATVVYFGIGILFGFLFFPAAKESYRSFFSKKRLRLYVSIWSGCLLIVSITLQSLVFLPAGIRLQGNIESDNFLLWLNPVTSFIESYRNLVLVQNLNSTNQLAEDILKNAVMLPVNSLDQNSQKVMALSDKPNLIIVQVESLRFDIINRIHHQVEVTPHLNQLARKGTLFERAYSTSTHTDYAEPSIVSSLLPVRGNYNHIAYSESDPWPKSLIYDVLKPYGYATALYSSDTEAWGGMDRFLKSKNLDVFFDSASSGLKFPVDPRDPGAYQAYKSGLLSTGSLPDAITLERAKDWIGQQTQNKKPFFLYLAFQNTHFPYVMPKGTPEPFQPSQLPSNCNFFYYPESLKEKAFNSYLNAVHEIDRLIGVLIQDLRKSGQLDHTIIAVVGDHGESFYENHQVTHSHMPLESMIRTTFLIAGSKYFSRAKIENYPVQIIDLAPTLLGLLGIPPQPNFQGVDVLSAKRRPLWSRMMYFHTSAIVTTEGVLWGDRWKFIRDIISQTEYLFDLKTDPGETQNKIALRQDVAQRLRQSVDYWIRGQQLYYSNKNYYTRFYPPQPRQMSEEFKSLYFSR